MGEGLPARATYAKQLSFITMSEGSKEESFPPVWTFGSHFNSIRAQTIICMISQSTCVLQSSLRQMVTYFLCQSRWVWDTWVTPGYFLFRQLIYKKSFKKRKSLAKLSQMRAIHMRYPPTPSDLPDQGSCSHPCLLSSLLQGKRTLVSNANLTCVVGMISSHITQDLPFNQSLVETIYTNQVNWMALWIELCPSEIHVLQP